MKLNREFVYELLERKYGQYNAVDFIDNDPVSVPHKFKKKQDIEIIGFWTAMLSWGNRKAIMTSANRLAELMDNSPYQFVLHHSDADLKKFLSFKHRTFNATDALYFIEFFSQYYTQHNSLEDAFITPLFLGAGQGLRTSPNKPFSMEKALSGFHETFFSLEDAPQRTRKHVATPLRGSTCKRMNMFLRWMVRKDRYGVDFGLWKKIKPSQLLCPLDIHVDRVARKLGLIRRTRTDWQAVLELTENLKTFDPKDPVKYDFALFGLSVLDKMNINLTM